MTAPSTNPQIPSPRLTEDMEAPPGARHGRAARVPGGLGGCGGCAVRADCVRRGDDRPLAFLAALRGVPARPRPHRPRAPALIRGPCTAQRGAFHRCRRPAPLGGTRLLGAAGLLLVGCSASVPVHVAHAVHETAAEACGLVDARDAGPAVHRLGVSRLVCGLVGAAVVARQMLGSVPLGHRRVIHHITFSFAGFPWPRHGPGHPPLARPQGPVAQPAFPPVSGKALAR